MIEKIVSQKQLKWAVSLVIIAFWASIFFSVYDDGNFLWEAAVGELGELAWGLLVFTIFVSLTQKIIRLHWPRFTDVGYLLPLRKQTGVLAFLIGGTHGLSALLSEEVSTVSEAFQKAFSTEHAMVFGALSFLIMLPLFLTSTNWAVKKMGMKSWKLLHKLAHLAFLFAVIHVALIDYFTRGEIEAGAFGLLAVYLLGYAYVFWKHHTKKRSQVSPSELNSENNSKQ